MQHKMALDEDNLHQVIVAFYEQVRTDALLGPVFNAAVSDWSDHHRRLTDFWHSLMLGSGRYKGNPVALHLVHAQAMTRQNFERWLILWQQTTDGMMAPELARTMQAKASRVAESLHLASIYRRSTT